MLVCYSGREDWIPPPVDLNMDAGKRHVQGSAMRRGGGEQWCRTVGSSSQDRWNWEMRLLGSGHDAHDGIAR